MTFTVLSVLTVLLVASACATSTAGSPEAGPSPEFDGTVIATVDTRLEPTAERVDPTPATAAAPTPTTRVIDLPIAPSDAAVACSRAGLVAAGLDACLKYEALGCTYFSGLTVCESARDQLESVQRSRIFPSDCPILPASEPDQPPWCEPTD